MTLNPAAGGGPRNSRMRSRLSLFLAGQNLVTVTALAMHPDRYRAHPHTIAIKHLKFGDEFASQDISVEDAR